MIEVETAPNKFMAAHNFIPYTISSDNSPEPNFNFVIDVNETGGTSNPLARLVYPVQPGTSRLEFDVGCVLKNYVSYDIDNVLSSIISPNQNSRVNYYLEFRELYDISGVPTLSSVLKSYPTVPSSTDFMVATNAVFDFEDYSALAYRNCDVSGFGFLNATLDEDEQIDLTQYRTLTFFDPNRVVTHVQVTANGIGPVTIPVTLTANEYLFNINAGKYLFETAGSVVTPTTILVKVLSSGTTLATKTMTSPVDCSVYDNVRIHWLNKLGAFESYNFNKNSFHNMDIERVSFKAPSQIGYSTSDRLKTNYNTTIIDKIKVNSDWISDSLSEYFEQLLTSPVVFVERSATDLVAINITNQNYEERTFMNGRRLFNLSFDFEYSYNRYRQTL